MKKYGIIVVITLFLVFGMCSPVFAAQDSTSKVLDLVAKTNDKIEKMIETAIQDGNDLQSQYQNDIANLANDQEKPDEVAKLTEKYNADLDKLIDDLIDSTNSDVSDLIIKAAKYGDLVESTYVEVTIADRTILVDPCRTRSY